MLFIYSVDYRNLLNRLPMDSQLRQIIDFDNCNAIIPFVPVSNWRQRADSWHYIGEKFRLARRCVPICPAIMPIWTVLTMLDGILPPLHTVSGLILASNVCCCNNADIVAARVYQAEAAWLREIHVASVLMHYGQVYKDLLLDLRAAVDLVFQRCDGVTLHVAVSHDGDSYLAKKSRKASKDVIYLAATGTSGLHLVNEETILSKCLK